MTDRHPTSKTIKVTRVPYVGRMQPFISADFDVTPIMLCFRDCCALHYQNPPEFELTKYPRCWTSLLHMFNAGAKNMVLRMTAQYIPSQLPVCCGSEQNEVGTPTYIPAPRVFRAFSPGCFRLPGRLPASCSARRGGGGEPHTCTTRCYRGKSISFDSSSCSLLGTP